LNTFARETAWMLGYGVSVWSFPAACYIAPGSLLEQSPRDRLRDAIDRIFDRNGPAIVLATEIVAAVAIDRWELSR
jgi:hypothetical protein